jgi:hypothetical protein
MVHTTFTTLLLVLTLAQLHSTIAMRDAFIKDLEEQARADALERRKLHNMVQELKGEAPCCGGL